MNSDLSKKRYPPDSGSLEIPGTSFFTLFGISCLDWSQWSFALICSTLPLSKSQNLASGDEQW
jgi:hypothetical protein